MPASKILKRDEFLALVKEGKYRLYEESGYVTHRTIKIEDVQVFQQDEEGGWGLIALEVAEGLD